MITLLEVVLIVAIEPLTTRGGSIASIRPPTANPAPGLFTLIVSMYPEKTSSITATDSCSAPPPDTITKSPFEYPDPPLITLIARNADDVKNSMFSKLSSTIISVTQYSPFANTPITVFELTYKSSMFLFETRLTANRSTIPDALEVLPVTLRLTSNE